MERMNGGTVEMVELVGMEGGILGRLARKLKCDQTWIAIVMGNK